MYMYICAHVQEYQPLHTTGASACVGSAAPYLLTNKKSQVALPNAQPFTSNVTKLVMQGFAGLQVSQADELSGCLKSDEGMGGGRVYHLPHVGTMPAASMERFILQ